jgi:hypothetical protein
MWQDHPYRVDRCQIQAAQSFSPNQFTIRSDLDYSAMRIWLHLLGDSWKMTFEHGLERLAGRLLEKQKRTFK